MSNASTRRGFVGWLAAALASIPFLGGMFVAGRAAATPARIDRPRRIPLCRVDQVPSAGLLPRPVSYDLRRGARVETVATTVFVTRDPDSGEILALSSRCTHLGCPVVFEPEDEQAPLHCPCHDAVFSATGAVLEGPPARPLDRMPIEVPDDGEGMIHLVLA